MAAAATSILSLHNMPALADSLAGGATSDSPGVLSGNTVQAPVHVPINACGNSVDVIGLLNPAFGNTCGNQTNPVRQTPEIPRQTGSSDTGASQTPPPTGVVSTPPVGRTPAPRPPSRAEQPQRGTAAEERQDDSSTYRLRPMGGVSQPTLAETGSGTMLATSGVSAALMAGGLILYRRGRAASYR